MLCVYVWLNANLYSRILFQRRRKMNTFLLLYMYLIYLMTCNIPALYVFALIFQKQVGAVKITLFNAEGW